MGEGKQNREDRDMIHREVLAELMMDMIRYEAGNTKRIQHCIKVRDLSSVIGSLEKLGEEDLYTLEAAAILHDIGVQKSLEKYGSYTGKTQEEEGPDEAEKLLRSLNSRRRQRGEDKAFTEEQIQRIRFLIAHHHTYQQERAADYQILLEADMLSNLYDHESKWAAVLAAEKNLFRTAAGTEILHQMYGGRYGEK
jgi:uncharacterized protein